MSMYLEFEPHSWYRGAAIRNNYDVLNGITETIPADKWTAYIENGNTYRVDELVAPTLAELKQKITEYRSKYHGLRRCADR